MLKVLGELFRVELFANTQHSRNALVFCVILIHNGINIDIDIGVITVESTFNTFVVIAVSIMIILSVHIIEVNDYPVLLS